MEIDNETLDELMKMSGETKKGPAISKAITEFVRRKKAREFGRMLREGAFDYPVTNEEVEKKDV